MSLKWRLLSHFKSQKLVITSQASYMTSFRLRLRAPYRSVRPNDTFINLQLGCGVSQRMIILKNNSLTRNPCLCAKLFKNLLKRWVSFTIDRICFYLNLQYYYTLNPCYDISTQLFFLLIITECTCKRNRNLVEFGDSRECECIQLKTEKSNKLREERCREVPTLSFQII